MHESEERAKGSLLFKIIRLVLWCLIPMNFVFQVVFRRSLPLY